LLLLLLLARGVTPQAKASVSALPLSDDRSAAMEALRERRMSEARDHEAQGVSWPR
jgi:hypothetical protein